MLVIATTAAPVPVVRAWVGLGSALPTGAYRVVFSVTATDPLRRVR